LELWRRSKQRRTRPASGDVADLEGEEADPQPPTLAAPTDSRKTKEEEYRLHGAREETERPCGEPDPMATNGGKHQDVCHLRDDHQTHQILQSLNGIAVGMEGNEVRKWRRGRRRWEGATYKDGTAGERGRRTDISAFPREHVRGSRRRRKSLRRRRREPSPEGTRPNLVSRCVGERRKNAPRRPSS
jgi:hypothetical protein